MQSDNDQLPTPYMHFTNETKKLYASYIYPKNMLYVKTHISNKGYIGKCIYPKTCHRENTYTQKRDICEIHIPILGI